MVKNIVNKKIALDKLNKNDDVYFKKLKENEFENAKKIYSNFIE